MTADPAHRHGGPDAGWYVPTDHGWQRITDAEVSDHGDAAHFMSDPNGRTMADREQEAAECAERRREREARMMPPEMYACRCDHGHPLDTPWCYLCEEPVFHGR